MLETLPRRVTLCGFSSVLPWRGLHPAIKPVFSAWREVEGRPKGREGREGGEFQGILLRQDEFQRFSID